MPAFWDVSTHSRSKAKTPRQLHLVSLQAQGQGRYRSHVTLVEDARYHEQRHWTSSGTCEEVQSALIGDVVRHWRWRVLSDQKGHVEIRMGSKFWLSLGGGLFTPNFMVPMRVAIDLIAQTEYLVEITASAVSEIFVWSFIPRPGDRSRYEDAFDAQFRNLIRATASIDQSGGHQWESL